jgi:hypothetical protein
MTAAYLCCCLLTTAFLIRTGWISLDIPGLNSPVIPTISLDEPSALSEAILFAAIVIMMVFAMMRVERVPNNLIKLQSTAEVVLALLLLRRAPRVNPVSGCPRDIIVYCIYPALK